MNDGGMAGLLGGGITLVCTLGIVAISVIAPLAIVGFIFYNISKKRQAAQQLIATGVPAQARVLALGQTGLYINNQPQLQIDLEVHPMAPNAPFRAQIRCIVPMMAMPAVQPGAALMVKFDPAAPQQRIEIDWNAMGYAGGPMVSPF